MPVRRFAGRGRQRRPALRPEPGAAERPLVALGSTRRPGRRTSHGASARIKPRRPAWKTLPCWYLLGTEDRAIPQALQRFMAERTDATIVEVAASHVSFVSPP